MLLFLASTPIPRCQCAYLRGVIEVQALAPLDAAVQTLEENEHEPRRDICPSDQAAVKQYNGVDVKSEQDVGYPYPAHGAVLRFPCLLPVRRHRVHRELCL